MVAQASAQDALKDALDDMEAHFNGAGHTYDTAFYNELVDCFGQDGDTQLHGSLQKAFYGHYLYWDEYAEFWEVDADYREHILGGQKIGRYQMQVQEPCNYASSVAYFRTAKQICDHGWAIDA